MENDLKQARIAMWSRRVAGFVRGRPPELVAQPTGHTEEVGHIEENAGLPEASGETTPSDDELARGEAGVEARWYLQTYPDVAASGMDPVAHYLDFGWREGRDPRPDFSTTDYLAIYDELTKAQQN